MFLFSLCQRPICIQLIPLLRDIPIESSWRFRHHYGYWIVDFPRPKCCVRCGWPRNFPKSPLVETWGWSHGFEQVRVVSHWSPPLNFLHHLFISTNAEILGCFSHTTTKARVYLLCILTKVLMKTMATVLSQKNSETCLKRTSERDYLAMKKW